MNRHIVLHGIDGSNPLGFLTALGTALITEHFCSTTRLSWENIQNFWRPVIWACQNSDENFLMLLHHTLAGNLSDPFEIDKKLPFSSELFRMALLRLTETATINKRREIDLLASFGTEIYSDKNGIFKETAFRMVRSGDSAGQGLPAYALAIRKHLDIDALNRALFHPWNYCDDDYSLRWDPLEDQRYALRWHNPESESNKKYAPKTMRGANALSIEALALFPVQPQKHENISTTCFSKIARKEFFTWPIWNKPISIDIIRSLLSLPDLHGTERPPRNDLTKRGVVEIYRCMRLAPNQYYKNFTAAVPA